MRSLCTLCARGGSKGVKNKNVRDLLGKPLLAHSLEQARASGLFELIAVSSDSSEILDCAQSWGADLVIKRPDALASDTSAKVPAIQHCVQSVEAHHGRFELIVDLDATSPLRSVEDIRGAVALLKESACPNVITGYPARRSPYFNLVELGKSGAVHLSKPLNPPVVRRQDAPACYDMNASIYVWRREALFTDSPVFQAETRLYVMPEERSWDIDSELDFKIVEWLMQQRTQ